MQYPGMMNQQQQMGNHGQQMDPNMLNQYMIMNPYQQQHMMNYQMMYQQPGQQGMMDQNMMQLQMQQQIPYTEPTEQL